MPERFAWPTLAEFRRRCGGGLVKQTKLMLRYAASRRFGAALADEVAASPQWSRFVADDVRRVYTAMSYFMDRRLGMAARFAAQRNDFRRARSAFAGAAAEAIASGKAVVLHDFGEGLQLCLGCNALSYHEGLWALLLRDADGTRLYSISFAFFGDDALLIGSVQGARAATDARDLTKRCHGLRPGPLLVEALRALACAIGARRLLAIDPTHHVKGRWNLRSRRLMFDYRALWIELGAQRAADGHWHLPIEATRRSAEEMPTRKRAMYRRRYEMLDRIADGAATALQPARPAATTVSP